MLDWLKVLVSPPKRAKKSDAATSNHVLVDSRSYPLVSLTAKGFIASHFDQSLAVGQNASVTIAVNDPCGKFSFGARCAITSTDAQGRFGAEFSILPPEVERVLAQYARNKSAAPKKKA